MGDIFSLLGMLLTLGVILFLAYLCTRHLSRWKLASMGLSGQQTGIETLDQCLLGNDARLLLVKVGEKHLLLGVSSAGVQTLAELSEHDIETWRQEGKAQSKQNPNFRTAFSEVIQHKKK